MNSDEILRDEVEEMFRDETRKARQEARKTWNIPSGYYDNKRYFKEWDGGFGLLEYYRELWEIKRKKHPHRGKKK